MCELEVMKMRKPFPRRFLQRELPSGSIQTAEGLDDRRMDRIKAPTAVRKQGKREAWIEFGNMLLQPSLYPSRSTEYNDRGKVSTCAKLGARFSQNRVLAISGSYDLANLKQR